MRTGRFSKGPAEVCQRYGESVSFDWRLYETTSRDRSLAERKAIGAPAPKNVSAQIKRWKAKL